MFQFEVLGSVEIYRNGERLDLKTPKLRTLTAILLCRPNDWTSTSTLIGALWRQHPPDTARKTLQVYIHRLRAHLRANRALSSSKGYKLVVANGELDATSFAELVSCASSLQDTDPIEASRHYVKALALWRGSAFTGHTDNPYIRRHVARLEELRVDAICQFAALEANLGRPESPLDLLFDAVGGHPHSAELSTALMSALDRSGRRADALEVYHRYRKAIQSELGVQPSKPMIELYGRILRSDQLPEGGLVSSGAATRRPVPRQLAHALRQFTGRHKEFERLNSLAKAHGRRVATITGMAGVGKTALVIQWGHSAAAHFPDGQLFLNLRGFGPGEPMTPADAMTSCLGALGVDVNGYGNTTTNLASVYQSTMATRRTLLVLDNARSSEQVKPLIPSNGRHMVLITSRNVLARQLDAEAAVEIALGPFSEEESIRFLEARLGQSFVGSELLDAQRVVASCAHLPLSLAVVAANALARRGTSVSSLAYELSSSSMWRTLRGDDTATNVRSVPVVVVSSAQPRCRRVVQGSWYPPRPDGGVGYRRIHGCPNSKEHSQTPRRVDCCQHDLRDGARQIRDARSTSCAGTRRRNT